MGFFNQGTGSSSLNYLEPVANFADIQSTYPSPSVDDSTYLTSTGERFKYDGSEWKKISQVKVDNGQILGDFTISYNTEKQALDFKYIGV